MAQQTKPASGDRVNQDDFERVCAVIESGHSALVLGETGSGIEEFSRAVYRHFEGELTCAIAVYKGSTKTFFKSLAEQLDIPTEIPVNEDRTRPMTVDEMKEEIAGNVTDETLLILPEAKRLPASVRYWLEDLVSAGVRLACFAPVNPGRDVFLQLLEVETELADDRTIRAVMQEEADRLGLQLNQSELAELQPLAGRNPMIARKVIQRRKLGIRQDKVEHTQYVVIMPVIVAALFSFAVVRFIGLGTNNKGMYVTGGIALTVAMGLKQLGRVQGSRKRLGQ